MIYPVDGKEYDKCDLIDRFFDLFPRFELIWAMSKLRYGKKENVGRWS